LRVCGQWDGCMVRSGRRRWETSTIPPQMCGSVCWGELHSTAAAPHSTPAPPPPSPFAPFPTPHLARHCSRGRVLPCYTHGVGGIADDGAGRARMPRITAGTSRRSSAAVLPRRTLGPRGLSHGGPSHTVPARGAGRALRVPSPSVRPSDALAPRGGVTDGARPTYIPRAAQRTHGGIARTVLPCWTHSCCRLGRRRARDTKVAGGAGTAHRRPPSRVLSCGALVGDCVTRRAARCTCIPGCAGTTARRASAGVRARRTDVRHWVWYNGANGAQVPCITRLTHNAGVAVPPRNTLGTRRCRGRRPRCAHPPWGARAAHCGACRAVPSRGAHVAGRTVRGRAGAAHEPCSTAAAGPRCAR
jgi:hypothetical protein